MHIKTRQFLELHARRRIGAFEVTLEQEMNQFWVTINRDEWVEICADLRELLDRDVEERSCRPSSPTSGWETVSQHDHPSGSIHTRRLAVPGGWLYQVSRNETHHRETHEQYLDRTHTEGWHPPVFVPFSTQTNHMKSP